MSSSSVVVKSNIWAPDYSGSRPKLSCRVKTETLRTARTATDSRDKETEGERDRERQSNASTENSET